MIDPNDIDTLVLEYLRNHVDAANYRAELGSPVTILLADDLSADRADLPRPFVIARRGPMPERDRTMSDYSLTFYHYDDIARGSTRVSRAAAALKAVLAPDAIDASPIQLSADGVLDEFSVSLGATYVDERRSLRVCDVLVRCIIG